MMWHICREFNVLPTDATFKALQPLQILWIAANMNAEVEAMKNRDGKTQRLEMDDEDFMATVSKIKKQQLG